MYSWQNSQGLDVSYQLMSSDVFTQIHSLSINSGADKAGNLLTPHEQLDFIMIDGVVQIDGLQKKEIELFPNLINTGGTISIRNLPSSQNLMTAKLFNTEGKISTSIVFEKNGDQMISSSIDMEPGLYYIRVNNSSFRLIIIWKTSFS